MKIVLVLMVSVMSVLSINAQTIAPFVAFGYGSYTMGELKEFQSEVLSSVGFPVELTDNYPDYYNYEIGLMYMLKSQGQKVGVSFGGMSTGSRATLTDYSGSYVLDNVVNGYKVGAIYEIGLTKLNNFEVAFNGNLSYLRTQYELEESLQLGGSGFNESLQLISDGVCFEPRIKISVPLKRFQISLQTGYFIDFSAALHLKGDKDAKIGVGDEPVGADFSGYRLNAVLSYRIN